MQGLAVLKVQVRDNRHILNSVRTSELQRITMAQRMLSSFYSQAEKKPRAKAKPVKKAAKKVKVAAKKK